MALGQRARRLRGAEARLSQPKPREVKRELTVMPNGQQMHGRFDHRMKDDVVARQVFAQRICAARRESSKLRQGFRGLRRPVQIAPAYAGKPPQIGDDLGAQFSQQFVEGELRFGLRKERLDGIEPLEEAGGQLDRVMLLSHACVWRPPCGVSAAWRSPSRRPVCGRR